MIQNMNVVIPRQPFLVFATTQYYKINVIKFGISHFYKFHANAEKMEFAKVIPDGSIDIMFHCEAKKPKALCYGTRTSVHHFNESIAIKKGDTIFGVRFLPGNVTFLKDCSAFELIENAIDLMQVGNYANMIEQICECHDFHKQIYIFLNTYMKQYHKENNNILLDKKLQLYLLQRIINSGGSVKVQKLSEEVVFSVRYLNQLFHEEYGMSPKEFEKMIRIQNVLTKLRKSKTIADVATDAGYYDQSHLSKEFKQVIGLSPKKYMRNLIDLDFDKKLIELS